MAIAINEEHQELAIVARAFLSDHGARGAESRLLNDPRRVPTQMAYCTREDHEQTLFVRIRHGNTGREERR